MHCMSVDDLVVSGRILVKYVNMFCNCENANKDFTKHLTGSILESKGIAAIFQKKGK